ncbi:MAG: TIGR00725 family protein [Candidatus Verstraetearchaeota archaeon]|nr:TIGR00725 family protein [Candidatus Verstraetearchaeota archaeon]
MIQIGVLTTYDPVPREVEEKARELGKQLARRGCIVVTGGNGGLMRVVSEAAYRAGGITVGIIASELENISSDHPWHNPYNLVRVATGQTFTSRSSIVVRSSDAVILLAGGIGSMTEICIAYNLKKPIVVLTGTGMLADRLLGLFPDGYLDHRKIVSLHFESDPCKAADLAIRLAEENSTGGIVK